LNRSVWWSAGFLALLLVVGCGGGRTQKKGIAKKSAPKTESLPPEVVESVLRSMVVGQAPSDYSSAMRHLNGFLASHSDRKPPVDAKTKELLDSLGGIDKSAVEGDVFTTQDLDYTLDVQALSAPSNALKQPTELATARKTFGWVVRHVQLATEAESPAGGMYLTLLRGRGTPQARTWIFLELLRHQGIDGAVVEGLAGSTGSLSAVFARSSDDKTEAFLFDAEAGSAAPNKAGDGPATLRDAIKDVSLVETTGAKSSGTAKTRLLAPIEPSALSGRIAFIGESLASEARLPLVFDLSRWRDSATKAFEGTSATLELWDWPQQHRNAAAKEQRDAAWDSVNLYWRKDQESPLRSLLAGDADAASKRFVKFDFEKSVDQFALELRSLNASNDATAKWAARTRQDVVYFGGVSLMERAEPNPGVARDWFERYLKQFATAEFSPESILAANRLSLRVFTEGTQKASGPGVRLWKLADDKQRKTIELCARDAARLASLTEGHAASVDQLIEQALLAAEDMAMNPMSDADRQARKTDPREQMIEEVKKKVGDQLAESPSAFGENLLKRHVQTLNRKINESLQTPPGVKEGMELVKGLSQRVVQARDSEASRASAAKNVLVELLLKVEREPEIASSPDFANARGALTGEELRLLADKSAPNNERRLDATRKLISAAFGPELLSNPSSQAIWVPAALRNLAACRLAQGKRDEAIATLKTSHPAIQPIHRRELDAWLRILEKHPKWSFD
jgi:hypothetical protein